MTNLHLEPGEGSLEELLADVDDGHLPRDEQELVDRRQAAQLPVRDADRVGDQGRQARPDAPRRDLHRASRPSSGARSTRVAGPEEWRLHGLTNCGKGQPGQHAHVSHGAVAGALPQRPGRRPLVSDGRSSSRERALAAVARRRGRGARPGRALRASPASPPRRCTSRRSIENATVDAARRPRRPGRRRRDEPHRRRGARASAARRAARGRGQLRRPTRTSPGSRRPADAARRSTGCDEETAALDAGGAGRARAARRSAPAAALGLYGYFTSGETELAVASTTGRRVVAGDDRRDACSRSPPATTRPATRRGRRWRVGDLDPARPRDEAAEQGGAHARRAASSSRAATAPCSSRTRSRELLQYFACDSLQRRSRSLEGRSYFDRPDRRAAVRRDVLARRRRARPARAAEGVRLRGRAEAARRRSSRTASRAASSGTARTAARAGDGASRPGTRRRRRSRSYGPLAVRALARGRRGRIARRARRARRRRHLRDAAPLPQHRRRARGRRSPG